MKQLYKLPAVITVLYFVFSSGLTYAITCFEPSPSVVNGVDPYSPQKVSEITASEYQAIMHVLISAQGKWSGKMDIKECLGTPDSPRIDEETKDVSAEAEYRDGHLKIDLNMYSPQKKMKQADTMDYFLTKNRFSVDPSDNTGDVRVVKITGNGVYFYLRRMNFAGKGHLAKEKLSSLEAAGGQLVIKEQFFVNGALVSQSVMKLQQ